MGKRRVSIAMGSLFALAGCSFAPPYAAPAVSMPAAYKEAGAWTVARPADQVPREGWWRVYRDATLNRLEPEVAVANPTLEAALARHDEASAYLAQARSGLFPTIGLETDVARERQSARKPLRGANQPNVYNTDSVDVALNYDLDLWGKVRNEVIAGKAAEDASAADAYFNLVGLDRQARILSDTIDTYERALRLTQSRHRGGIASDLDVSRAQTQLESARAAASDVAARRAVYEHAIATLTGMPASDFSLPPSDSPSYLPRLPTGIPATLLQRRPDIAAAERRVAEANAQIGVTKAAFFPDISLGLDGGFQSDTFSPWFAAPNEIWSIGPTLVMTLFDGGRRTALVHEARAKLAENGANYKATVLTACQQVEDNLALIHHLGTESVQEDAALNAAQRTLNLSLSQYRDGFVSYLDVVTAQTTELSTQLADTQLQTRQIEATVGLIQALGGGWDAN
jgi:NodT family efflux transporter outer membrane factor (OMF) lipoprotein